MPVNGGEASSSSSSMAPETAKLRKPRNLFDHPETPDPPILIPSIVQSRSSSKVPTISSILHSGGLHSGDPAPPRISKKPFSPASKFRGLGCTATASQQVSVPSAIRASADWERRKPKKHHKRGLLSGGGGGRSRNQGCSSSASCVVAEDAWCGPGIGFSDADSECVVVVGRRNVAAGRGKVDGQRERPWHHRHIRYPSPEGLDEVMMLHGGVLLGDRHRGWRLDVDDMSYEQLLELGDRIGYVNTGLKEDEIRHCIRKIKISNINNYFDTKTDGKCSICQEEYEEDDELGKLECGHGYHFECIKQWLSQKNKCPVCKTEAAAAPASS